MIRICCILFTVFLLNESRAADERIEALPRTKPLSWKEKDLSERLMNGAHKFVERKMVEAAQQRARHWKRDASSPQAYAKSVAANRQRLRTILGVVDARLPARMERFGDDDNPALVAQTERYRVYQVRWPVLDGIFGEGLLVQPTLPPQAQLVVVPDADQSPEQLLGLAPGLKPADQSARRLAENGFELVIPTLVSREKLATDDTRLQRSDQTYREWIYRQAFHMGRHVIGYEVQKVLAAVDWFGQQHDDAKIGVVGYAEGAMIAFFAAAVDVRIDAALVSGYFDSREAVWAEPIYRNVWSRLLEFGDAEVAGLILPRILVVEHSPTSTITGHKGDWKTPASASVAREFRRIVVPAGFTAPVLIQGEQKAPTGPLSIPALKALADRLSLDAQLSLSDDVPVDRRKSPNLAARKLRAADQMETHVQALVRGSEHVRDEFFLYAVEPGLRSWKWSTEKVLPTVVAKNFIAQSKSYRKQFHEDAMGRFDERLLPTNPRTRKILENDRWTAYDVVLDVYPELFSWGVVLVPKGIKPGERRPVVVCQHGRNGVPRDTIDAGKTAYNDFAAALADRGFVTFAPHNLYRGEDRYRWLDRKANTVKASLWSFIISQHRQILTWLATQPYVDKQRIAFYGLSFGGETAVRIPTILEDYALSICSGDYNQWTRKVAATDQPFSFMRSIEWELPHWNLGHTFDYAEMTYLMLPRPFMVERGHRDGVGRDQWVAHEYAKARWLYAQFGLADRMEIEFFQGGHSIHGRQTFEFLHKHLNWPGQ